MRTRSIHYSGPKSFKELQVNYFTFFFFCHFIPSLKSSQVMEINGNDEMFPIEYVLCSLSWLFHQIWWWVWVCSLNNCLMTFWILWKSSSKPQTFKQFKVSLMCLTCYYARWFSHPACLYVFANIPFFSKDFFN